MRWLLGLLLLTGAAVAQSSPPSRASGNMPASETKQPSPPDQRGTEKMPLSAKILPPDDAKAKAEQEERDRKQKTDDDKKLIVETQRIADYTFWLGAFTLALFCAAVGQIGLFVWQLQLIRESLGDAKQAADAATQGARAAELNAQALIDAESAQLYVIAMGSNVPRLFQLGKIYDNSPTMGPSPSEAPWVEYRLRNYGKSPAIVQQVLHGVAVENPKDKQSRNYSHWQAAMEIVGVGEQSLPIRCTFDESLTFDDVRSIVTNDRLLFFFGRAVFIDNFGRKHTLDWEFLADEGKWQLIAHSDIRETATKS